MSKNELSQQVIDLLNRDVTTVIVATVDEDGSPRTAPFGWVYAKDSQHIRFATSRGHDTYKNIVRNGRVMVCLLEEENTALSIRGNASVYKESFDCVRHMAMIEIDITTIKSDVSRVGNVTSGINTKVNDRFRDMMKDVYAEMKN
jgi:uncharacterized pyridoxamine 5'-phosphate oxidase family protein